MGNTNPTPFTGLDGSQYVAVLAGVDGSGNPDALKTNGSGVLLTSVSGAGSGGTSATDDATFTAATDAGTPMMGFASSDSVDSGDVGVVGMTTNRHLKVNIASSDVSIGGGTEYTEGDTDASITGGAILWEDTSDTLRPVSAAKPLPVDLKNTSVAVTAASLPLPTGAATSANQTTANGLLTTIDADTGNISTKIDTLAGAVSGTEMQVDVLTMPTTTVQATNLDIRDLSSASDTVTIHGDVGVLDQIDLTNSNPAAVAIVDGNGDQITSFGGGTQYTEGDTDASITGTAMLFETNTGTNTLGVVSASNPLPISDNSGSITVDNGGTFAVQAAQSGTWNINNVSGTVSLPTGASTAANQTTIIGHLDGVEGLLTTIDGDTGEISAHIGTLSDAATTAGGTGSVSAKLRLATSQLDSIKTSVETLDNAISGSEMQVDVVAALPAGTNAIGKLAANDGVDIGDVTINNASIAVTNAGTFAVQDSQVVTDNAGFSDGTTKVQPAGYIYDEVAGTALTENDAAAARINVNRAQVQTIEDGTTRGRYATVTASNALKVDGSSVAQPVTDNSGSLTVDAPVGTPVFVTATPSTTGGWSVNSQTSLTNSKIAVKASAGTFGGYMFYNPNSSAVYIQVWDVASASVTVGTTAPTYVIPLPATAAANIEFSNGINHATAITVAATTTATGSTAPSSTLTGFFLYK